MIVVGIDVAKDKHDCFIMNSEGEVLFNPFVIQNNREGFDSLYEKICSASDDFTKVKVGLEATGHYSYNILGYLLDKGLPTYVINPLHTNLYRKSLSLRKTKTDKVDARYRFDKVKERAKLKTSVARLVNILFPELEKLVSTLHMASVYELLSQYPSAKQIASVHLTKLTNLLSTASKGRYGKERAEEIRIAAKNSIGSDMPAKSLELKHTIKLIRELDAEIEEIEFHIEIIMDEINSPILTIPGISYRMGAMIIAEIGDFDNFNSPNKILAYAGLSPSTYQSGQLTSSCSHMEKRGSRYLRYALFNATKFVCNWDNTFAEYLAKKRSEGKHYNVAISHACKKLVRVIYHLETTGESYRR